MTEPTLGRAKILVVDDDAANLRLAEAILTSAGYSFEGALSGREAIDAFLRDAPELILLDVIMPGMDGFETLESIRELPGGESVRIMVLTGLDDLTSVHRALDGGADDFATKPYNRVELLLRIQALLDAKRDGGADHTGDTLASLLVHDLKHPLTTIYFMAGLLRRDESLSPKAKDKVGRILRASERLESMILSILDVTRSEKDGLAIESDDVDIQALVEEVAQVHRIQAESNGLRLEVVSTGAIDRMTGDRDVLRRLIENLVDNAQRYAPANSTVRIELRQEPAEIMLRVRDDGPPIPRESRRAVFEKQSQTESGLRRARTGRGLGLVFVRLAAEAHGGSVEVEDLGERGATFCVRIPHGTRRPSA